MSSLVLRLASGRTHLGADQLFWRDFEAFEQEHIFLLSTNFSDKIILSYFLSFDILVKSVWLSTGRERMNASQLAAAHHKSQEEINERNHAQEKAKEVC